MPRWPAGCCPRCGGPASRARCPIVCDAASCTEGLRQMLESELAAADGRYAALRVVDAVAFVEETCAAEAVADPQASGRWRCIRPARRPGWD